MYKAAELLHNTLLTEFEKLLISFLFSSIRHNMHPHPAQPHQDNPSQCHGINALHLNMVGMSPFLYKTLEHEEFPYAIYRNQPILPLHERVESQGFFYF